MDETFDPNTAKLDPSVEEWRQNLLHNLSLTPEERALKHQKALNLANVFRQVHKELYKDLYEQGPESSH